MVESPIVVLPSARGFDADTEAPKPQLKTIETTDTYGKFALEPLPRGLGVTLGNPMRRVLIGSLRGAAVTWVRIDGVLNEYSTIPHMKEDILELVQNIKAIRIRALSDMPGRLQLSATGPGEVTAGDMVVPPEFEIVNPELHIASLDSSEGRLRAEFNVGLGTGYVPAQHGSDLPIGTLQVDAIYSPVRKVNFAVELTRVGQVTDYERLVVEIWTDGTMSPTDALRHSAAIVSEHLVLFTRAGMAEEAAPTVFGVAASLAPDVYNMLIERLELSSRTFNCLKRAGINKVGEVLERPKAELERIRNFGEKSFSELVSRLQERGLPLPAGTEPKSNGAAPAGQE